MAYKNYKLILGDLNSYICDIQFSYSVDGNREIFVTQSRSIIRSVESKSIIHESDIYLGIIDLKFHNDGHNDVGYIYFGDHTSLKEYQMADTETLETIFNEISEELKTAHNLELITEVDVEHFINLELVSEKITESNKAAEQSQKGFFGGIF